MVETKYRNSELSETLTEFVRSFHELENDHLPTIYCTECYQFNKPMLKLNQRLILYKLNERDPMPGG